MTPYEALTLCTWVATAAIVTWVAVTIRNKIVSRRKLAQAMQEMHGIWTDHVKKSTKAPDDFEYMRFEGTAKAWNAFLDKHGDANVRVSGGYTREGPDGVTVSYSIMYKPCDVMSPERSKDDA